MDWKIALKVGGPSIVATWVFYSIITFILSESEIFKTNIILHFFVIIVVFIFCLVMGLKLMSAGNKKHKNTFIKNEVVDNKVDENLNIALNSSEIKDNKIKGNTVKKDMNIGGR